MAPSVPFGPRPPSPGPGLLTRHSVPGQGRPRPRRNLHNTRGPRRGTWLVGRSNIGLASPAWSSTLTVFPTTFGRAWSSRSSISVLLVTSLCPLGDALNPCNANPSVLARREVLLERCHPRRHDPAIARCRTLDEPRSRTGPFQARHRRGPAPNHQPVAARLLL